LADGSLAKSVSSNMTNKVARLFHKEDSDSWLLESIKEQSHKSLAQIALNWCISHPGVIAIPKSNSVERTVENCGASGWSLTTEQIDALESLYPL